MDKYQKPKILVCAFACLKDPDRRFGSGGGGEGFLGKNIILQLDRFYNVSVLTHITNKADIVNEKLFSQIKFYYIDLPKFLNFTKKWIQLYAYLWQIRAYFIAQKLNKDEHFTIFHHITYANDWMASFIGALLSIPYIRGPGGGSQRVPKKFLKEFSLLEKTKENIRSVGQWFFKHDPFFIIGQNKAKAILVCNKESFSALPKKWQEKAYFFPVNGLSKKDLLLQKQKSNNSFVVLSAGKLIKIKGFDLSIKAFKIFSEKNPDVKLIIVGEGPEFKALKKIASEYKIEYNVYFKGWLSREELLQEMNLCDVFLFPSLRDGGGNVIVEAMAASNPVVCFDLAGPGFHIDDTCGIKIKADNPEQAVNDMAKALEKLYLNRNFKIKLGEGAREKAEKEYNWDKLGDKLKEIYIATLNYKKFL